MLRHNIGCPFCGLCCDDLTIKSEPERLTVEANGCPLSERGFSQSPATGGSNHQPRIQGHACSLNEAVDHAADLLGNARLPLFGGLGTDVAGARAVLSLADRAGAVLDHMNSESMLRNLLAVQDSGWMTATLGVVRNRVDLLMIFGSAIEKHAPRFYERFFNNAESMFGQDTSARELIIIGSSADAPTAHGDARITSIPCPTDRLGDIAMTLRALLQGRPLQAENVAGIPVAQLREIVTRLADAHYGVIAWATDELDFPHAELAVQAFSGLVKDLNITTRCSGMPLGGNNGDYTFSQVATWQAGFPTRISLASGCPHFDPIQYNWERLLESDEADLLLWISAFDTQRTPPSGNTPGIVLGRAGMQCEIEPEVFIPVATPGIDHAGHVYRCDIVVAIPLCSVRDSDLPEVSMVLNAISERL
ncbi:MAG: formylmethanofuran dehydrogenase subunit B [Gammaproteobacteria bacterium]|nr:formylmethanofuran dehydrogenase subunit B [Gammaproteobacteria bacterium]